MNHSALPDDLLKKILADAAGRTGFKDSDIVLLSAESVTWPDGSIGCPEPGLAYTQALVPGYRVVLQANREKHIYHVGRGGSFRWCPPEQAQMQSPVVDPRV